MGREEEFENKFNFYASQVSFCARLSSILILLRLLFQLSLINRERPDQIQLVNPKIHGVNCIAYVLKKMVRKGQYLPFLLSTHLKTQEVTASERLLC
jgi:hypothetical protein